MSGKSQTIIAVAGSLTAIAGLATATVNGLIPAFKKGDTPAAEAPAAEGEGQAGRSYTPGERVAFPEGWVEAERYRVNVSACWPYTDAPGVSCTFQIEPSSPITLSNAGNSSAVHTVGGSSVLASEISDTGGDEVFEITTEPTSPQPMNLPVSETQQASVDLYFPNISSVDNISAFTFSIGSGDPGVTIGES